MLWVKLQVGTVQAWLELEAATETALQQIKGLQLGAELFAQVPVQIIDTRYSKHPTELTWTREGIKALVKEQSTTKKESI